MMSIFVKNGWFVFFFAVYQPFLDYSFLIVRSIDFLSETFINNGFGITMNSSDRSSTVQPKDETTPFSRVTLPINEL